MAWPVRCGCAVNRGAARTLPGGGSHDLATFGPWHGDNDHGADVARADADHVLKGGSQAQPSGKRVHGLAGEQLPARWVGARLKLESDAHRRLLVHTRQLRRPSGVAASRRHRCFLPAAAAVLFRCGQSASAPDRRLSVY